MSNPFSNFFLLLSGLGHTTLSYLESTVFPVLKSESGALLEQLAPIALGIVTQIETTGTVSNNKRDEAYGQLKSAAVAAGINAATSVLNKSIEDAVAAMHASQSK